MITRLAHVCLLSSDLDKTLAFYTGVLGLAKRFNFLRDGKLFGFYLDAGDRQYIEVFQTGDLPEARAPRITHLCLEVADIHALAARLREHGIACKEPRLGADESWQVWCKDPDGVDIEFHQYTERSHQFSGENCLVNW